MPDQNVTSPRQLEDQVWRCVDQGNMEQALKMCAHLNQEFPDYAPGWRSQSHLAQRIKKPGLALAAITRAIELEPGNSEWLLQQCYCLLQLGRKTEAIPLARDLARHKLANAYQYSNMALILSRLDMHEDAAQKYRESVRLEPGESQHHYNLATVQRFLGDFDGAEASLGRAIELDPSDYPVYKLRADLRRQTLESNHVAQLESMLSAGIKDSRGRVEVLFAIAKELEDIGEFTRSFTYLQQGADLRRSQMRYDVQSDIDTMQRIQSVFGAAEFRAVTEPAGAADPVFVLGMPRTGTTLVERILGSHSQLQSLGELNDFAIQLTQAVRNTLSAGAARPSKMELVSLSADIDFQALGAAYLKSATADSPHPGRFIDKMPLNFLYIGLIHKALPGAKIIHLQRHPLDTCFAIYKTLFKDAYPFSYSLQELGRYYLAYEQLMRHWHCVMPGLVHTVRYEDLVQDSERTISRMLEYCGLPWEDACLQFHHSAAASTTASASQVREPIYTSSVANWRNYAEQLQPLTGLFSDAGVKLD